MRPKKPHREDLEELLGYRFKDAKLLQEALTHASARNERSGQDNERLEFLGDRVLGLAVAAMLFESLPEAREVEFALHYNSLVRRDCCAEIAAKLNLGPHIIMAASEARSGGRNKAVILADACEALLGAVFQDGGFAEAQAVVTTWWGPLIEGAGPPERDAKTALQEYAQRQKRGLPKYLEMSRSGADHAPSFTVEVEVQGLMPAQGSGTSLKKAQQAAAEALLIREAVWVRERENA